MLYERNCGSRKICPFEDGPECAMGHRIKGLIEIDEQRVALLRFRIKGFEMIQMISALVAGKATVLDF